MLLCMICACFLFSCQKEVTETLPNNGGGSTSYYIKGKLDGVDFNYTSYAMAVKMDFGGFQTLSFVGGPTLGGIEGVNFSIDNTPSGNPLATGTYTESDATSFLLAAVYVVTATDVYGAGILPSPPNPFTIIITELTATTAKGTFGGDVYNNNGFGPLKKTFTQGQFNLKF